jgi:hypothetical protein
VVHLVDEVVVAVVGKRQYRPRQSRFLPDLQNAGIVAGKGVIGEVKRRGVFGRDLGMCGEPYPAVRFVAGGLEPVAEIQLDRLIGRLKRRLEVDLGDASLRRRRLDERHVPGLLEGDLPVGGGPLQFRHDRLVRRERLQRVPERPVDDQLPRVHVPEVVFLAAHGETPPRDLDAALMGVTVVPLGVVVGNDRSRGGIDDVQVRLGDGIVTPRRGAFLVEGVDVPRDRAFGADDVDVFPGVVLDRVGRIGRR